MPVGDYTGPIQLYWFIGHAKRLEVPRRSREFLACRNPKDSTITCIQLQMPLLHLHYSRHGHVDVYFVPRQSQTRTT